MRRRNRENEAGNSQGMFYAEHVVCSLGATEGFVQLRCRVPAMRWQSSKTPTHLNNPGFVLPNTCVTTLASLAADQEATTGQHWCCTKVAMV